MKYICLKLGTGLVESEVELDAKRKHHLLHIALPANSFRECSDNHINLVKWANFFSQCHDKISLLPRVVGVTL